MCTCEGFSPTGGATHWQRTLAITKGDSMIPGGPDFGPTILQTRADIQFSCQKEVLLRVQSCILVCWSEAAKWDVDCILSQKWSPCQCSAGDFLYFSNTSNLSMGNINDQAWWKWWRRLQASPNISWIITHDKTTNIWTPTRIWSSARPALFGRWFLDRWKFGDETQRF